MPRYTVLEHDHPFPHWDLLLENGNSCRTWRLLSAPDSLKDPIAADESFDHRLIYLEYEGPVSGQRGTVARWDAGHFEWRSQGPDLVEVDVSGRRWQGTVRLERINGPSWQLIRAT